MFFFFVFLVMFSGVRYYFYLKDIIFWRVLNIFFIGFNLIVMIVIIFIIVIYRWGENSIIFDFF